MTQQFLWRTSERGNGRAALVDKRRDRRVCNPGSNPVPEPEIHRPEPLQHYGLFVSEGGT